MNTLQATVQELGFPTIEEFARFHALDILENKLVRIIFRMFDRESIDDLLHHYSDIISNYTILKDNFIDDRYIFEIRIEFTDQSKLENREVFLFIDSAVKRRYKFHWMNSDNSLILR